MLESQQQLRTNMQNLLNTSGKSLPWAEKKVLSQVIVELSRRDVPSDKLVQLNKLYEQVKSKVEGKT